MMIVIDLVKSQVSKKEGLETSGDIWSTPGGPTKREEFEGVCWKLAGEFKMVQETGEDV